MAAKQTRIIINGAAGRMGRLACEVIGALPQFSIVARCGRADDLTAKIHETKAAVVFDVTEATSVYHNTETILKAGARPIIGTSGLTETQVNTLSEVAEAHQLGGIIAPNFSLGALLMMRFAKETAKYFFQAEII